MPRVNEDWNTWASVKAGGEETKSTFDTINTGLCNDERVLVRPKI